MKRLIFGIMLASSVISCQKNEVTRTPQPDAINFGHAYLGLQTKANPTLSSSITLGVAGFQGDREVFKNSSLAHNTVSDKWELSPKEYWPIGTDVKMNFYAYAPYKANLSEPNSSTQIFNTGYPTFAGGNAQASVTIPPAANIDFLYAVAKDVTKGSPVNFAMAHALTKVQFTASAPAESNIIITSIKLAGIKSVGYFTSSAAGENLWSSTSTIEGYTILDAGNVAVTETAAQVGSSLLLIPQALENGATVTIKGTDNGVAFTFANVKLNTLGTTPLTSWNLNQSVTYAITFATQDEIEFSTPTVTPWDVVNGGSSIN